MRTFKIVNVETHFIVEAADISEATAKVKAHHAYRSTGVALTVSSFNVTDADKLRAVNALTHRHGVTSSLKFKAVSSNLSVAGHLNGGMSVHIKDILLRAAAHVTLFKGGDVIETVTINKALYDHWGANLSNYVIIEEV